MTQLPSRGASVACLCSSLGFCLGLAVSGCYGTKEHLRTAFDVTEVACEVLPRVDQDAKELCVTREEYLRAIRDIVSRRGKEGAAPGSGQPTLKVRLPELPRCSLPLSLSLRPPRPPRS